jgi:hypothetical protein
MPQINSIPEVLYQPNQPYHYHYDNLPLKNILTRIGLVNIQVDSNTDALLGTGGSVGSLASRLDVSLAEDGTLKAAAVDDALHSIAEHSDTDEYVRMTVEERDKLALVASDANKLFVEIEDTLPTLGEYVTMDAGTVRFRNSSTIFFDFIAPDIVRAHSLFPATYAHRHNYSLAPAHTVPGEPDYTNFLTTSLGTAFVEGSLRVYVNGVRLSGAPTMVCSWFSSSSSCVETYVEVQDYEAGTFSLNRALSEDDVIIIDFDEIFDPPAIGLSSSSSSSSRSSSSSSSRSSSSSSSRSSSSSSSSSS